MSLRLAVLILALAAMLALAILLVPLAADAQRGAYRRITPFAGPGSDESDKALTVTYRDGLLTVRCTNAALTEVFGRLEATTGVDVVFHRSVDRACRNDGFFLNHAVVTASLLLEWQGKVGLGLIVVGLAGFVLSAVQVYGNNIRKRGVAKVFRRLA